MLKMLPRFLICHGHFFRCVLCFTVYFSRCVNEYAKGKQKTNFESVIFEWLLKCGGVKLLNVQAVVFLFESPGIGWLLRESDEKIFLRVARTDQPMQVPKWRGHCRVLSAEVAWPRKQWKKREKRSCCGLSSNAKRVKSSCLESSSRFRQ